MSEVHAIKKHDDIDRVEKFLLRKYGTHFSDIWKLGINLALRASDLLAITHNDTNHAIATGYLTILERKTAYKTINRGTPEQERVRTNVRPRVIKLNKTATRIMKERITDHHNSEWLFQSTAKNHRRDKREAAHHLSYQAVWQAFKLAGENIGVKMGTHTMRKTRGYMMYKDGVKIEQICRMFNHSDPKMTMHYIGLIQESIDKSYDDYEL